MKRQNVRTLSLIVVTFTYLLLGAAMFDLLESNQEVDDEKKFREKEMEFRHRFNLSQDDIDAIKQLGIQMRPYKAGTQWKFAGAFYFATTVITTIGYGHSTPKTATGKIFCMCYAVPGIPLTLIMFQSIGERMNTLITKVLRQLKHYLGCKSRHVSQTLLMMVSFTTGLLVLTCGAFVFSKCELWSYLDAFYYCFITLTTIGFGDYVALQRDDFMAKRPEYVAFSLIFIIFGLTVVSSVMNLLVLRCLTLNTEDERRDQLAAAVQAQELKRLHGDVIWFDDHNQVDLTRRQKSLSRTNRPVVARSNNSDGLHNLFTGLFSWFVNGGQVTSTRSRQGHDKQTQPRGQAIEDLEADWRPTYSPTHHHCNQNYADSQTEALVCNFCPRIGPSQQPMASRAAKVNEEDFPFVCGRRLIMDSPVAESHDKLSLAPDFTDSQSCLTAVGHFSHQPNDIPPYVCTASVLANCHLNYSRLTAQGQSSYSLSSLYSYTTLHEEERQHLTGLTDSELPRQRTPDYIRDCYGDKLTGGWGRPTRKGRFKKRLHVTTSQLIFTNRYVSMSAENSHQSLDMSLYSGSDEEQLECVGVNSDGLEPSPRRFVGCRTRRKSVSV